MKSTTSCSTYIVSHIARPNPLLCDRKGLAGLIVYIYQFKCFHQTISGLQINLLIIFVNLYVAVTSPTYVFTVIQKHLMK